MQNDTSKKNPQRKRRERLITQTYISKMKTGGQHTVG